MSSSLPTGSSASTSDNEKSCNVDIRASSSASPRDSHVPNRNTLVDHICVWWPLVGHLLVTAALATGIVFCLDGYLALENDPTDSTTQSTLPGILYVGSTTKRLYVAEIVTIISSVLVLIRLCVSTWVGVTIWRCAYILLETCPDGVKLSQLRRMMGFGVPSVWPVGKASWVVSIVLILLLPQPFVAPLVTGAVGWSASAEFVGMRKVPFINHSFQALNNLLKSEGDLAVDETGEEGAEDVKGDGESVLWTLFLGDEINSIWDTVRVNAAANAIVMWALDSTNALETDTAAGDGALRPGHCRHRTGNPGYGVEIPLGSYSTNTALPCLFLSDISWSSPPKRFTDKSFSDERPEFIDMGYVFVGEPEARNLSARIGYKEQLEVYPLPEPNTYQDTLSLAVLLFSLDDKDSCSIESLGADGGKTMFGSLPQELTNAALFSNQRGCWAYGTIDLAAGVVEFEKAQFLASTVMEGKLSSTQSSISVDDLSADTWVTPAIALTNDVIELMTKSNATRLPTWNNLDQYLHQLLYQSFPATWGSLHSFHWETPELEVTLAQPRLKAGVNTVRVWVWFALQLCVPLSGLLWWFGAQKECKRGLVVSAPGMEALLMSAENVVEDKQEGGRANGNYKESGLIALECGLLENETRLKLEVDETGRCELRLVRHQKGEQV